MSPPDLKLSLLMSNKKDKSGSKDEEINLRARAKTDFNQARKDS
jgi:hypothetical protein